VRKVYFSGSIRGGRGFVDEYFEIIKFLKNNFVVLTEHIGDKNLNSSGEKNKTDEYIFQRDCSWIDESDFVVAEVTNPSLGVGYEICYAEKLNKPILCLYKNNGNKISAMINGNKYLSVYPYNNIEEAQEIIDKFTNDLS